MHCRFFTFCRFLPLATIVLAVLSALAAPPALAAGDHCKSSSHFMHDGSVYSVDLVDIVDRDGDGYASAFKIRVRADSRQLRPRQKGKPLMKVVHKIFMSQMPISFPFTADKRCIDLIPGYHVEVKTMDGRQIDWGYRHMNNYEDYPGPGRKHDQADFYVGPFSGIEEEGRIILSRRPDDGEPRRAFENDGSLTGGERAELKVMAILVGWKPMGRGGAADTDIPKVFGCLKRSDNYGDDLIDKFRAILAQQVPANGIFVQLDERYEGGFKIETPELDVKGNLESAEQQPTDRPEPMVKVYGKVASIKGNHAISRAEVVFRHREGNFRRHVISATDGSYAVKLRPGTYDILVDQRLYQESRSTVKVFADDTDVTKHVFMEADEKAVERAQRVAETIAAGNEPLPGHELTLPGFEKSTAPLNIDERIDALGGSGEVSDFAGVWDSSFGELRLYQVDGFLAGDYADEGVIFGKVRGDCAAGVFTNADRNGTFRFQMTDDESFTGKWAWYGEELAGDWDGKLSRSSTPEALNNFTRGDGTTRTVANARTVFDGTYDSAHGAVELRCRDLFLFGDYADKGVLVGMWDGNSFVGLFTEGDHTGWFDLAFYSENGAFRSGRRGWVGSDSSQSWSMQRIRNGTPSIDNLRADIFCQSENAEPAGSKTGLQEDLKINTNLPSSPAINP